MELSGQPLVYVIVLVWNQLDETMECLESLTRTTYANCKIVLVDNGSTDGTPEAVARTFPEIEIIYNQGNIGVGPGYNTGIVCALERGADYVMVINNDTVTGPELVSELVKAMQDHPGAGMTAPKIYHYYGDRHRLWCVGAKWRAFPPRIKLIGADAPDGPEFERFFPLEYATGCCMLVSRPALEKAGMFDPGYFFYFEDWDICARYRAAGYEIWFVPTARLWHKVSVTWQNNDRPAKWWFYSGQSSVRFYLRYTSPVILALYTAWFALRETAKLNLSRVPPYLHGVASGLARRLAGEV
jgi:GT2 family glycosyltransferase